MKTMKNLSKRGFIVLLSLVLCFGMTVPAFAVNETETGAEAIEETSEIVEETPEIIEETPEIIEEITETAGEPETEAPVYATLDDFEDACDAMGDADDEESILAVLDDIEAVYNSLSDEDKAAVADQWAYVQSYAASAKAGNPDAGIQTLAQVKGESFTVNVVKVVNGNAVESVTLTKTCLQSTSHSGYVHNTNVRDLANSSGFSGYIGYNWSNYTTVPSSYNKGAPQNNPYWTVNYNITGSAPYKANQTLFLFFETTKTFTLKYDANGGSGAPAQQTATTTGSSHNFTVSGTEPKRAGYDFLGWSTSSTAASASYQGGESINVTGTTTLYAVWQQKTAEEVTLTYMDRSSQYAQDTYAKGTTATVRNCTNTCNNHTFQGWDTDPAAETAVYSAGDTFTINADTTLYAVWQKNEVKITVTWRDGYTDDPIKVETVKQGITNKELEEYYPDDPAREGYVFAGWGSPETDENGNITITAKWTEITTPTKTYKYTLNYMVKNADNDGTVANMPESYTATSTAMTHDTTVSTQIPIRDGYTFSYWTLGPAGAQYNSGADFHFEASSEGTSTVTCNLYAHWTKDPDPVKTVTVTWVDEDGETVLDGPKTFNKGEDEPTTDVNPTKAEDANYTYEFDKWERSEDENGNVTYRATYTPTPKPVIPETVIITVNFVDEKGATVKTATVTDVEKDSSYNVAETAGNIPEGYEANGDPYGDSVTGIADSNKTVTVPVKKTSDPVDPDPVDPDPVDPDPVDPDPVDPDPVDPDPVDPDPVRPVPPIRIPVSSTPVSSAPVNPIPVEPPVVIEDQEVPLANLPEEEPVEIPDEEPPLADLPEEEEIDDLDIPLAEVPQTGDNSWIWTVLAAVSGAGFVLLTLADKKRKSDAQ